MNRELTLREKVLLLILIVLVMVLGYFKLLYEPVSDRIARCREDTRRCCASCAACSRARGNTPSISATARRSRAISSCAPSP